MASQLDVPLNVASVSIVRQCGPTLIDVLQSKFGCTVKIQGVNFSRPTIVPEERFSVHFRKGPKVSVWKADLTSFKVDAVVNAANIQLQHYGGVALALSNAGGPEIQTESNQYISLHGPLETGDAILTNAGHLPCKKIIHAVGPRLPENITRDSILTAEPLLAKAVRNILAVAEKHSLQSVAIPALSSGLFRFPLAHCADVIVGTLKQHYDQKCFPREIFLVNNDEPSVREMERACRQILAHKPLPYSQAAGSQGRGAAQTSPYTIQIRHVSLILRKGKIEEQETDVIVNTISPDLNLSVGQISSALVKKAGEKMQKEIREHKTNDVIATKPYRLQCKMVYHTVCTSKKNTAAQQILFSAILECLRKAASNNYRSIAFPAIGTGNLGFSKKDAAKIMTDAVVAFSQEFPQKMDIHFVIYPPDNDTFKAFEKEMRSLQDRASHPSSSHGFEHNDDFRGSRVSTPQITLSSTSDETTHEAKRWLSDLFNSSGTVVVRNNFIQYFGEQEFQWLSLKNNRGVIIDEFFEEGCAGVIVQGKSIEDVVVVWLQVEAMLCNVQRTFVKDEECTMPLMSTTNVSYERKPIDRSSTEFRGIQSMFRIHELRIHRVEKVENPALKELFELKGKQLHSSIPPRQMYQRIPAQFCNMVSHIGFQREYAPPNNPMYGEGIYFAGSVNKAMEVWKDLADEEYLYFVEAMVLTGKSTPGKPGLIVPPAVGDDPVVLYDSVSGGADISVVFNGYQALPKYIVICKKLSTLSSGSSTFI